MGWMWKGYIRPSLNPDLLFNEYALFQVCHLPFQLRLEMEVPETSDFEFDECRKV